MYDYDKKKIIGIPTSTSMLCSPTNFPINLVFSKMHDEYYCLYRHGEFLCFSKEFEIESHSHSHKEVQGHGESSSELLTDEDEAELYP